MEKLADEVRKLNLAVLFGSGVSKFSGVPLVNEITCKLLYADVNGTHDGRFYILDHQLSADQYVFKNLIIQLREILNLLKVEIENFNKTLSKTHPVNYEEIFYLLFQIENSLVSEYENAATLRLIKHLNTIQKIDGKDFQNRIKECVHFVYHIVKNLINVKITNCNQFDILNELKACFNLNYIYTLNHDLVLENWFELNKIKYQDGFQRVNCSYPEWVGFKDINQLRYLKLHGSIDWMSFEIRNPLIYHNYLKIPLNKDPYFLNLNDANISYPSDGLSTFLMGTFNKLNYYLVDIYEELFDLFKNSLLEHEVILIAGYGFGDKGVNSKLLKWLFRPKSKYMIIVHPNKDELVNTCRGAFNQRISNSDNKDSKIKFIEKKFEDLIVSDIESFIA